MGRVLHFKKPEPVVEPLAEVMVVISVTARVKARHEDVMKTAQAIVLEICEDAHLLGWTSIEGEVITDGST